MNDIFMLLSGFLLLLGGAELMVRGAVAIAKKMGVSTMAIGMTVVAFGTSAPELVVSMQATLDGSSGIALGNLVGSNIANILLILGATAIILPIGTDHPNLKRDGITLLVGTAVFLIIVLAGDIRWWGGVILLVCFAFFLKQTWSQKDGLAESLAHDATDIGTLKAPVAWLFALGGIGGLLYGADLLVEGGVNLARAFAVSEEIIGLTIIAFGTSLPELAASVVAAMRGHSDLAIGNVIGSNLFNILMVAGLVSVVHPLAVPVQIIGFDIWVMVIASLLLLPFALSQQRLSRWQAAIFLGSYGAFIAAQATGFAPRSAQWVVRWIGL